MTDKRADENVVELKRPSKDKRSKDQRQKTEQPKADDTIALCVAAVRGATAPVSDVMSRMIEGYEKMHAAMNEMIKINNKLVDNQNRMVTAIESLEKYTVAEISALEDKIEKLEAQNGWLEETIDRKYRDDLVARDRRRGAA